jgi:hypothetical protein
VWNVEKTRLSFFVASDRSKGDRQIQLLSSTLMLHCIISKTSNIYFYDGTKYS